MKTILIAGTITALFTFTTADKLTGRWQTPPSEKGNITSIFFKADNSFEGYVNKKAFTSGNYTLQGDIFSFTDNGCNGVKGTYKVIFFSNGDSLRLQPVSDSCTERKEGISRLVLGKIKN